MSLTADERSWLAVVVVGVLGIVLIWRLYRMASDTSVRIRDSDGREITADELESDEPLEIRPERDEERERLRAEERQEGRPD